MAIPKVKLFTVDTINMTVKLENNLEFYIIVSNLELYLYISSTKTPEPYSHLFNEGKITKLGVRSYMSCSKGAVVIEGEPATSYCTAGSEACAAGPVVPGRAPYLTRRLHVSAHPASHCWPACNREETAWVLCSGPSSHHAFKPHRDCQEDRPFPMETLVSEDGLLKTLDSTTQTLTSPKPWPPQAALTF